MAVRRPGGQVSGSEQFAVSDVRAAQQLSLAIVLPLAAVRVTGT